MYQRLPDWLKRGIIDTEKTKSVRKILKNYNLNTVCDSARCPNKCECYAKNTATFMIMGKNCTRGCRFCSIEGNTPEPINPDEPKMVAKAVAELGLQYAVITSVTRDDLPLGGSEYFAQTILEIKKLSPDTKVEVLTPDFLGNKKAIDIVIQAMPDVFNHNIETVKRLYATARPQAEYERTLEFLSYIKSQNSSIYTKSGFMIGLGETNEEILGLLHDLKNHNCDIVTIGQYIQPTRKHLMVEKFYTPDEFESLKLEAEKIGIKYPVSSPLVRSSYNAAEVLK
jgi:lipoic acid synthetase